MNYIQFNYYTISLLIGGFIALISAIVIISQNWRQSINQAWFALTICTSIWSFGYFVMTVSPTYEVALISNWVLHYAAIFIPLFYYLLVLIIVNKVRENLRLFLFFACCALFFSIINLSPIFVLTVVPKVGFNYAPVPGPLYLYFFIYFVMLVMSGIFIAAVTAFQSKDASTRIRLFYTIFFAATAAIGGGSVFLTTFFSNIPPYLLVLFSIYPLISGYAILKYRLLDIKIIATQLLIFALWVFIFIRVLLSQSLREEIINIFLFIATILLGLFVIRSVKKEVDQREHIQSLANDLSKANEKLKELDQLKSEFVSLATHQIRSPLTAIKGYVSLIEEGDYGPVSKDVKEALDVVHKSTDNLVTIVGDFLDVSRIEQGRMKYDFKDFDLQDLVRQVVTELKPNIEKKGLAINYSFDKDKKYSINGDFGKIKQIIGNIIDNSIKYTPAGQIAVSLSKPSGDKALIKISDTGVGIPVKVMPKLFKKFSRAENANDVNIIGTGLGLYVAKQMIDAHHGRIWAESKGENKGSQFYIELPAKTTA